LTLPVVSIALVGCSGPKLEHPAPARDLYTSQLFRQALKLAELRHDVVYVVSAKLELVLLDQVIEPYNKTMSTIAKEFRPIWGSRVWDVIVHRHQKVDRQVYVYAGKDYARPLRRAGFHQATFHEPLARLMIGQRLAWLKAEIAKHPTRPEASIGAASGGSSGAGEAAR
jgi:hypothetical protein